MLFLRPLMCVPLMAIVTPLDPDPDGYGVSVVGISEYVFFARRRMRM